MLAQSFYWPQTKTSFKRQFYTVYTVYTYYTVYTVDTVDTVNMVYAIYIMVGRIHFHLCRCETFIERIFYKEDGQDQLKLKVSFM